MDVLCETVAAAATRRQARGVVVCGFPIDLRQAQLYEAKVGTRHLSYYMVDMVNRKLTCVSVCVSDG